MDSSIPRSRGILAPQSQCRWGENSTEILFERQKFDLITKEQPGIEVDFGIISMANFDDNADNKPETFNTYVNKCKEVIEGQQMDFLLVCGSGSFLRTRAAIIAAKECCATARVFPLVQVDSQMKSVDGWNPLAQVLTVQALGCDGVLIDCEQDEILGQLLREIAPYVKIPVAVWCDDLGIADENLPYVTHLVIKDGADKGKLINHAAALGFFDIAQKTAEKSADIVGVSNGKVWFLDSYVDIGEPVECDEDFDENLLLSEEDEAPVTKVSIPDEDALDIFETEQYMINEPVAICSEDEQIFARAVRMFCGIAIYDGTGEIDDQLLRGLNRQYGLVIL